MNHGDRFTYARAVDDPEIERLDDQRRALLKRLGFDRLQHDSHVPFISHLVGTRRTLARWGERQALCDAGLLHSAYGTEYFEFDSPATRDEVRDVVGAEAERIAWLWCTIERDHIDVSVPSAPNRHTGDTIELSEQELADLATLWAADTVEQIDRMADDEQDFAAGLRNVLRYASEPARHATEALDQQV